MASKHNSLKTVGTQTAPLLNALYDRAQTTFTLADAVEITGLRSALASSLLYKAAHRGLVSRLKRGVWVLVPPEMGSATEYAGNPFLCIKFPAIALGILNVAALSSFPAWKQHRIRELSSREQSTLAVFGGISLFCWLTAVTAGRMIGYW